ncbi:uncharacterized protein OCT59_014833 [Rhizophagus irregularis]|uniref:uncharacterized protein n=1 Tax=Rhizophagus irregularis TaxID=588596 RepID=UPI003320F53E|nr:hypothetical protein OCT59_014833 [Rhizophagus irregularis]
MLYHEIKWIPNPHAYVDTGCWPELKHSAGLGFRNAGQDPISIGIQKPHTTNRKLILKEKIIYSKLFSNIARVL